MRVRTFDLEGVKLGGPTSVREENGVDYEIPHRSERRRKHPLLKTLKLFSNKLILKTFSNIDKL